MNEDAARALAQQLLKEGRTEWEVGFRVESPSREEVVIVVRRRTPLLEKRADSSTFVSLAPAGTPCPRCGGSGLA